MSIHIDTSDLDKLAADLARVAEDVMPEAKKVVGKGCLNIKKDWKRRWSGLAHAPAIPYAIGYDVRQRGPFIEGEVGPDKSKRQGALGNLLEYGSVKNAPIPGGAPALEAEEPRYVKQMYDLGTKMLDKL